MLLTDQRRRSVGIALTPLVDVVFILLLFFMLTSTFDRLQQVSVTAPSATKAVPGEPRVRVQLLALDANRILVDGQTLHRDSEAFEALVTEWINDARMIAVGGRQGATVQHLISLLDQLAKAGVEKMGLFESVGKP